MEPFSGGVGSDSNVGELESGSIRISQIDDCMREVEPSGRISWGDVAQAFGHGQNDQRAAVELRGVHDDCDVEATVEVGVGVVGSGEDRFRVGNTERRWQRVDASVGLNGRRVDTRGEGLGSRENSEGLHCLRPRKGVDEPLSVGRGANLSGSVGVGKRDSRSRRVGVDRG